MCWLGVALGSMAILMIRHLTGGGWGMVIRRILGAAMRTLPLLALLFIPIILGMHKLYIWAQPLDQISDKHLREHLEDITKTYLTTNGFIIRAIFYFAIWNLLSYLLSHWSKQTDRAGAPDNTERFKAVAGPGLILYGFTISFAAIDWVMSLDPSWISTIFGLVILIGEVLSAMCFAVVVERILFNYKPMSEMLRPDFVHDHGKWMLDLHHGLGVLQLFAVAHHLGRQLAVGDHLLHAAFERRLGIRRLVHRDLPLRHPVRDSALAPVQAQHPQAGLVGGLAHADALPGFVLDHRAEFLHDVQRDRR